MLKKDYEKVYQKSLYFTLFLIFLFILYIFYFILFKKFIPILYGWDVYASWFRWAQELSQNIYKPYNQFYTIIIPSLWSINLKFIFSDYFSYFSRLTLFIFPLLILIPSFLFLYYQKFITFLIYLLFTLIFYFNNSDLHFSSHTGMMDGLLMIFTLFSISIFYLLKDLKNFNKYIILSSASFAILSLIKQQGILILIAYNCVLIYFFFTKQINYFKFIKNIFISNFLIIIFILIFVTSKKYPNSDDINSFFPVGPSFKYAFLFLKDKYFYLCLFTSIVSFIFSKKYKVELMIFFLVFMSIFILTYICCSYDKRNFMWFSAISFVNITPFLFFLDETFNKKVQQKIISLVNIKKIYIFFILTFSIVMALVHKPDYLEFVDHKFKKFFFGDAEGGNSSYSLVKKNYQILKDKVVISKETRFAWTQFAEISKYAKTFSDYIQISKNYAGTAEVYVLDNIDNSFFFDKKKIADNSIIKIYGRDETEVFELLLIDSFEN